SFVLNEKVGPVSCTISQKGGAYKANFVLPKLPTFQAVEPDMDLLGRALGLARNQIGLPGHNCSVCDAGVPYPVVPLSGLKAMGDIKINAQALGSCMETIGRLAEVYVYTTECVWPDSDYHVRMFSPAFGITEDPATGSAAAAFTAHIMEIEKPKDGQQNYVIEQGLEMGRPSRIELKLEVGGGRLQQAEIGGQAVIVAEGHLRL
ncbi:MAG TPA: PhzF family phenazine biosynthesis protein, partial [Hellea balneolensis]|nr:PhzF family phenazine biosynthesis protein [Hellea balneolensis]